MRYITMTAEFDDMDSADATARSITRHFPSVKGVKLCYRKGGQNLSNYSTVGLTAANNAIYTNVGFGVVPPQGIQPVAAAFIGEHKPYDYIERKVRLSLVAPQEKQMALTSCIINGGGHYVKVK